MKHVWFILLVCLRLPVTLGWLGRFILLVGFRLAVRLSWMGRSCVLPFVVVAGTLSGCFVLGNSVCGLSNEHVVFELIVATGAVVIHHASNDLIRRIRSWRRRP